MKISRRFTQDGQSPYAGIDFDPRTSEIRNPDGSSRLPPGGHLRAGRVVGGGHRHPGPEVLPEVRACRSSPLTASRCSTAPATRCSAASATPARSSTGWPAAGPTGARSTATSTGPRTPSAFYDELCHMLAAQIAAPNSPQWFNTGLHYAYGHQRPGPGPLLRRSRRPARSRARRRRTSARSRTPASSSRVARRPRQRRRHHGPLGPRGAHLQVRLGHRAPTSRACAARTSRSRAAASRRA